MSPATDPAAYGRWWADDYDELFDSRDDPADVIAFVRSHTAGGRVLELGVGTGRLAVPMAAAGLDVTGVDASPEMLRRLAERPGGDRVRVIVDDFTDVDAGGPYDVALIAFSTLFLLPSQPQQLACLGTCRRHLDDGGVLAVEAFVPDHSRWTRRQNVSIGELGADAVSLKLSVHDPVQQLITMTDVRFAPDGHSFRPNVLRYIWPAELDAMALASGLTPIGRWAGWDGAPFTADSGSHVSVYRRNG